MLQRVLVVMENEGIRPPAIDYARELALRLDAEVTLLMVVEMAILDKSWLGSKRSAISGLDQRVGRQLSDIASELLKSGISASVALRVGDPAQEFVKFLAERPPFQSVIWGSGDHLPEDKGRHWISRVADSLECPLWTVSSRNRAEY
jgi:nucleotide-binding universal stress UspA family protein